ncbi:hypothetical protein T484DRAFT_1749770 [Baffinella frigidus]|nr:hypothetical protein T484DRAFT_1749770 [Cryptophyta sp. CCMP2293]
MVDGTSEVDANTRMRDWLDSVGTKVIDALDSFVVRAPKITLLSTKTVSDNTKTSAPAARHPQIPMRACSLPISFEPSAPSSSATARDQLTNGNTRRLPPPPLIAKEKDSGKIQVRAAILALRRAVACADQLQSERKLIVHIENVFAYICNGTDGCNQ